MQDIITYFTLEAESKQELEVESEMAIITPLEKYEDDDSADVTTTDAQEVILLGWLVFSPLYMLWVVEAVYAFSACWVCLSAQYWINYPGLTKREVLQILKLKTLASPQRRD